MNQSVLFTATQKKLFSWLTFFIVPISGVCVDVYSPSLPHMAVSFQVVKALAQLSITTYMVGFAVGQLLAGPLSDSFGRRRIMLVACVVFLIVTGLIILSPSINWLLAWRVIQGVTIACVVVPARAILSDCFSGAEFSKKVGTMTVFWAMGPIVAPAIGGYLQYHFNWQASFWFMMAYAVIVLLLVFLLYGETHHNRSIFSMSTVFHNYVTIIRDASFLWPVFFLGILSSVFVVFNVVAPFIVQDTLLHSSIFYGYVALSMGVAWFAGTVVNGFLGGVPLRKKTQISLLIMAVILLGMLLASEIVLLNIYLLVIPLWGVVFCASLVFPNYVSFCLARYPRVAGSANALLFSCIWAMVALVSAAATYLHIHSLVPFAVFYAAICVVCWVIYYGALRSRVS